MLKRYYRGSVLLLVLISIGAITLMQPLLANDTLASTDALFATVGSDLNHYTEFDGLISVGGNHESDIAVVIYPKANTDIRSYAHMAFTIGNYGLTTYIDQYLMGQTNTGIDWSESIFATDHDQYILIIMDDGLTTALEDIATYGDSILGIIVINTAIPEALSSFDGFILCFDQTNDPTHDYSTDLAMIESSRDSVILAQNHVIATLLDRLGIDNDLDRAHGLTNVIIELTTYPNDAITDYLDDPNYAVSLVTDAIGQGRVERIEKKLKLGGEIVIIDDHVNDVAAIRALCDTYNAQLLVVPSSND